MGEIPFVLAACVVDFTMNNIYSIPLSKKRLTDGPAHDRTGLDSWTSLPRARLPLSTIYTRSQRPYKSVCQRQRASVSGASGETCVIVKRAKFKSNLTLSPTSQSETMKNNSTKLKNKLKKMCAHFWHLSLMNVYYNIKREYRPARDQMARLRKVQKDGHLLL